MQNILTPLKNATSVIVNTPSDPGGLHIILMLDQSLRLCDTLVHLEIKLSLQVMSFKHLRQQMKSKFATHKKGVSFVGDEGNIGHAWNSLSFVIICKERVENIQVRNKCTGLY